MRRSTGMLQINLNHKQINAIFVIFDEDGDGGLSFEEARKAHTAWRYLLSNEDAMKAEVMKYDPEGTGFFDFKQFHVIIIKNQIVILIEDLSYRK